MAAERHSISCACGHETAVAAAAAGTIWQCPRCGAEQPLPSFRQLRKRPILAELADRPPPFQFSLASLFLITLMAGCYLTAVNFWGFWRVTFACFAIVIYGAIQGLLLYRGKSLIVYANVLAFAVVVLFMPVPVWLLNQREQAKAHASMRKLGLVGLRQLEEVMLHGESRQNLDTSRRLESEMFPEGI